MNSLSDAFTLFVRGFLFFLGGVGGGGREGGREGASSKIKATRMDEVSDMITCTMLNGVYYIILC